MGRPKKCTRQIDISSYYEAESSKKEKKRKELQAATNAVLEELFGDGPEITNAAADMEETQVLTKDNAKEKLKKPRSWRPAWKLTHGWAYPVVDENKKLRIKCMWCVYSRCKNPYANKGASTIQLPALEGHSISEEHKMAELKWHIRNNRACVPLPEYIAVFEDKEKARVVTVMWQLYFLIKCNAPLDMFEELCLHQIEQSLPNMPLQVDYGTYVNRKSGMEFLQAIKDVLWTALCEEIQQSPWYSLIVDDSTDRRKEGHLIVYINYMKQAGRGPNHVVFIKLLRNDDGGAEAKYLAIQSLMNEMGLPLQKLTSFATDGCSVMVGCREGLIARFKSDVPYLFAVHCLAHRENLAISQALSFFPEFVKLDKLCKSMYAWLHASGKRTDDFKLIEAALDLPELAMLQIHSIRWLSRGQVMERIVQIMPALLIEFGKEKPSIYEELMVYAVQLCIHLLADVCTELNVLNSQFQSDLVDVASISGYVDATLKNLRKKFLRDSTNCGSKHLQKFVQQTKDGQIRFVDAGGELHVYELKFESIEGSNRGGLFEDCMLLAKELVAKIVENI